MNDNNIINISAPYTIDYPDLSTDLSMASSNILSIGSNGTNIWDIGTYTTSYSNDNSVVEINKTGITMEEGCDIKIGSRSLINILDTISERLAILETNSKLEKEFDQLRELGNQYRKLEAELKEQMTTWESLKKDYK